MTEVPVAEGPCALETLAPDKLPFHVTCKRFLQRCVLDPLISSTHLLLTVLLPRLVSSLAQPARMLLPVLATVWAFHLNRSTIPSFHQISFRQMSTSGAASAESFHLSLVPSFHHSIRCQRPVRRARDVICAGVCWVRVPCGGHKTRI